MSAQVTDHADQAVARLPAKHKGKTNIEALVRLCIAPKQEIEDVLAAMLLARYIDTAADEQLNVLGRIVGQPRNGLSDADYRRYIRARIATNKSKGRWSDIQIVTRLILDDTAATLVCSESDYMTCLMEVTGITVTNAIADILIGFLRQTKSDVVRMLLKYSEYDSGNTFTLGSVTYITTTILTIGSTQFDVASTAGFEDSGSLILDKDTANEETVTYTSKDATTFYGVSATVNIHNLGDKVHTADSTTQGFGDGASPSTGGRLASVLT